MLLDDPAIRNTRSSTHSSQLRKPANLISKLVANREGFNDCHRHNESTGLGLRESRTSGSGVWDTGRV